MKVSKLWAAAALAVASMVPAANAQAAPSGPVSGTPVTWTPSIADSGTDGSVELVRQLVPCGDTMYAAGKFSTIKQKGTVYPRVNVFSFSASNGTLTSWAPAVNGIVNSVAVSSDCQTVYLGGKFSSVDGVKVGNLAAVDATTGQLKTGFKHSANGQVNTLLMSGGHLLVGGYFTKVNGSNRAYMASLNPATGSDDSYVNLNISGNYQYVDDSGRSARPNPSRVYNLELSPSGDRLLVMGDFTSVAGQARRQMFMLDLQSTAATLDPWYSKEFDANCAVNEAFWLQAASWAPDGSKVYIATTGYKPANGLGFRTSDPRAGLCDAAAAFPSTPTLVSHLWVNYTGCDSLYSTAADESTVYIGGHERWASNPGQCDNNRSGTAVEAPGMAGLSPSSGAVTFNPTRGRGKGADDMIITQAGLWIASDNAQNSNACGRKANGTPAYGHAGICLLPY